MAAAVLGIVCLTMFLAAGSSGVEADVRAALDTLPGKKAFAFTELTDEGPKLLYGVNPDEQMAIGSGFKLYIFGVLADDVNAHRRRLENVMLLQRDLQGPPHSELASWPVGSPATLNTLTLKMISISDNTATDHLLYLLGRRRVERQMRVMGHSDPAVNRPLLFTREMALLRDKAAGTPGREYGKLDEAGRRKFLNRFRGPRDYDALDFDAQAFDLAEWFASPVDMAHALAWIQAHTLPDQPAHPMLGILAIDPKLAYDPAEWPYVGFKGGSEERLLAGNWLMQNRNGRWYTMHVYCNSPDEPVDPQQTLGAIKKILGAVESSLPENAVPERR